MKKRRPQQPRTYTLLDELAASPTEPLPAAHRLHQLTRMWQGLAAMEQDAEPSRDDWRVVSDAVNLIETLIEMRVLADESGLLHDAVAGMAMAGKRNLAGGPIRLDGAGIRAVRGLLEDYAQAVEILPARVMIRAHRLTETRIRDIINGKRRPHDVEIVSC